MAGKTKEMTADLEEAAKKDASEVVRAAEMAARAPAKVAEDGDPNMEAQEIFIPMNPASPEDTEITVGLNGKQDGGGRQGEICRYKPCKRVGRVSGHRTLLYGYF